jgi:hypothetical protein
MTSDGLGTMAIARRTGTSKPAVWRWQRRFIDEGVDGLLRDASRPSRIPPLGEASAPHADRIRRRAKLGRDRLVLGSLGSQKNNPRPSRQTLCRPPPPRQLIEFPTLRHRKFNRNR